MDKDTLEAFRTTWEMDRAHRMVTEAKLDALAMLITEHCNIEYNLFMQHLRVATHEILKTQLEQVEKKNPAFAARVLAWLEGEAPNFPLDQQPSDESPPSTAA